MCKGSAHIRVLYTLSDRAISLCSAASW